MMNGRTQAGEIARNGNVAALAKRIVYYTSVFFSQSGASILFIKLLEAFNHDAYEAFAFLPVSTRPEVSKLKNAAALSGRIFYLPVVCLTRRLFNPLSWLPFLWRSACAIRSMRRLLRAQRIDLVHANDMRDFHAPIAAWTCGIPVVWHLRASRSQPLLRLPFAWMYHVFSTKIIASSLRNGEQMLLRASHRQNKVAVVYDPGPYRDRFHPHVDGEPVRRALGFALDVPVITMIAKYSPRKGHLLFLEAMAQVLQKFPRAKFMIVGGAMAGHEAYARKLRARAQRFVQAESLVLTGERSDVPELIAASDIIVHCSLYDDPFPGVVMEGMAVGRIVIGCSAGGVPEQITHGEDGFLFKMGDARDLADKIVFALSEPRKMHPVRASAITNLERKFGFAKSQQGMARIYREVLGMAVEAHETVSRLVLQP
jgi:glycosyltransferase involved in cell wall biosynthesis